LLRNNCVFRRDTNSNQLQRTKDPQRNGELSQLAN
jgi:hypothetical protein